MNIGITTIYAHRPIVNFSAYLAKLLADNGDNISSLVCDASLPTCYSILSKNSNKLRECPKCIIGGLRSYDIDNYYSINKERKSKLNKANISEIAMSSIMTLERAEVPEHVSNDRRSLKEQSMLGESVSIAYQNTIDWIEKEKLDLVICYNGRMDVTKAIISACENKGVKFITLERAPYGYGIQLIPEGNCLSLSERISMNEYFKDIELSVNENKIANWLANMRISQESHLEWRTYKLNEIEKDDRFIHPKIIILPSSGCEFYGNKEWESPWGHFTNALDTFLDKLQGYTVDDIAIKMHPVWEQNIGSKGGEHITDYYREWSIKNGVRIIEASDPIPTNTLISNAELVVVGGSSAGVDAALLGKKVLLLGRSHYEGAGFVCQIRSDSEWGKLDSLDFDDTDKIISRAKKYLLTVTFRHPRFSDKVVPLSYFKYSFKDDSADCIYEMARTGELSPWNVDFSNFDVDSELTKNGNLINIPSNAKFISVKRRVMYRWVDSIRGLFPRGDEIKKGKK